MTIHDSHAERFSRLSRAFGTVTAAFLLVLLLTLPTDRARAGGGEGEGAISVMTFNLRYASDRPPNSWPERRPVVRALLEKYSPDLIGTQEGLYPQLKDVAADLPHHAWIGLGREGGSRGEFMAIFYKPDRFEPLEFDHFWLSDTPDVIGSTTWGNSVRRMVTWIRFLDRRSQRQFFLVNTHFDHQVEEARQKSAALVRKRIQELKPDLPVLLIGDFNARGGNSKTHEILTAGEFLIDAWTDAAKRKSEDLDTFHNYQPATKMGRRIDWILHRGGWTVDAAEVVTFSKDGQFPSDHFPVAAWVRFAK